MKLASNAHIVILTGAGISKESGLDTFRDTDGIWQRYSLDDVCTPEGFARDPALVHSFYNDRRRQLTDPAVVPNAAHKALAELEREWPGKVTLVTQNIDDLHERAGSGTILHMHGELLQVRCVACQVTALTRDDTSSQSMCAACRKPGLIRPDIVWFGEMPYYMEMIERALMDADLFVAIGTSGTVYPAAGFGAMAYHYGAQTVEINLQPSEKASVFAKDFYGPATEQVPLFVSAVLENI